MRMTGTFDSFVVSETSRAAWMAAVAVAVRPGRAHNPLVLHGPAGSGRTHLLQAIEQAMPPHLKVVRIEASDFLDQRVAVGKDLAAFRDSLRGIDALLLDDLTLACKGKPISLSEILRTLEEMIDGGSQVVFTADEAPAAWLSRFPAALAADLGHPTAEARVEILRRAAEARRVSLREEMLEHLAREHTHVRELQASVARIAFELTIESQSGSVSESQRRRLRDL